MNVVCSPRIPLQILGIWMALVIVPSGCSTSRWGYDRRQAQPAFANRVIGDSALQKKSATSNGVTSDAESQPASVSPQSKSIKQVAGIEEELSLEEETDSDILLAQSSRQNRNPVTTARLLIPKELPGADAPTVDLPPNDTDDPDNRAKEIAKKFVALPVIEDSQVNAIATERIYTLEDLQSIALNSNPLMSQAEARIMSSRGVAMQAGLHPNPTIGYEADTVGSNANPNYQGGYINTVIKTAGKLQLAESAANVDIWNSELMRTKTRIDLITQVRGNYYAAIIARENVKVTEALVRFTDSVYQIQLDQLRGGLVSVYEPIQLRALAVQARTALKQARNRYDAAWRQLAASVGTPDMPIGELAGSPNIEIPEIDYCAALPYVLSNHTDVLAARNSETQARINLRLQEVTPIPDILFYTALQKDYTTAPVYRLTYNMQIGLPVPIFDQNQGNIMNAHGTLMRASQEAARVQNELANRLADAIERYSNASNIAEMYREHVLPDQARAYRGVYERRQQQPDDIGFADVVQAQQTLLASINIYINSLAVRWQAFTDIGSLIQAETIEGIEAVIQAGGETQEDLMPLIPPGPTSE